jgi:2-dehydropantoate 2-reductase
VVVLQNGVDHADRVRPLLPAGTTLLPALVYVATEMLEPGRTGAAEPRDPRPDARR